MPFQHACAHCGSVMESRYRTPRRRFCSVAGWSAHCEALTEQRFWSHVDRSGGPDACWPWLASCFDAGYGKFAKNQRLHYAHRFAYELAHGSVPDGLFVCHSCDSPSCCNPAHLFAGTHLDNMRDAVSKNRTCRGPRATGEKVGTARLTWEKVRAIRAAYESGVVSQHALARQYGVSQSTVWRVVHGEYWRER